MLAEIPGISPQVAFSPELDDLVVFYIDGRFDVISVDVFGQLGRIEISGINVTQLPHHHVVNSIQAIRVVRGKGYTVALWYDNLFAANQRVRYVKLYDNGELSSKQQVIELEALDPAGAYSSQHQLLFTCFSRPVSGGYHIYGRIISLWD